MSEKSLREMYPAIEPYASGMLEVGDGQRVYWETCGNPQGKPAVVLHGGPGSGYTPWFRRLFDPHAYRIILFDQRNCGRSLPHAGDAETSLAHNTTDHLIADIERLRQFLQIDRWLVFGGSWGSTLALAYAERYPERVTEIILFGVTTGRHEEMDWLFRGGVARFFPEQWERLRAGTPEAKEDADVVAAYARRLNDPDPSIRARAVEDWCLWESATPAWPPIQGMAKRFTDPRYALAFARIVTHYISHNAWLEDEVLLRGAAALAAIPGILVNGRFDFQAPIGNAWALKHVWPRAELWIVDDAGHSASHEGITSALVRATDRFTGPGNG
jgi:proline iminopeptidase